MYSAEAKFHRLINRLNPITDPMVAEIVATELYQVAYDLDSGHPWSTCLVETNSLYHEQLSKFLILYKDTNIASFGINFESFMGMSQDSILTIIKATAKDAETAPSKPK